MKAVGIIILSEDETSILLSKRSAHEEDEQGKWENVGGKLESGETFEDAIHREIKEELGVEIASYEEVLEYGNAESHTHIKVFKVKIQGTPKIMEPEMCDEINWIKISELNSVDLAKYSREDFVKLGWIND